MRKPQRAFALFALVAGGLLLPLAGCGLAPISLCSYTFTGAASGSGTCTASGAFKASVNQSELAIVGIVGPGAYLGGAGVIVSGKYANGTYTSTVSSTVKGGAVPQIGTGGAVTSQWLTSFGNYGGGSNSNFADQGSYSLQITGASAGITGSGGDQIWTLHGTLTGSAPPSPATPNAAMGTVSYTINF